MLVILCFSRTQSFARSSMDAALNHMKDKGTDVSQEDISRLSPLQHSHINVLGHYSFVLTDLISEGKLRPLNH